MESINEIETRLQGLEDIKHLLRSVRAMSAIRWRRAKKNLEVAQDYARAVDGQLATVVARNDGAIPKYIFLQGGSLSGKKSVGLITLTSDRGLCGNFNSGLINKAIDLTEKMQRNNRSVKIISLGGYGERLFRNAGYTIFQTEQMPSSQAMSFINFRKVISHIRAYYESGAIQELVILYNRFNYFGSYTPRTINLLPPVIRKKMILDSPVREDLIIHGNFDALFHYLLWEHLAARLYLAFIESTISEHSARLQTMDAALTNLDERVDALKIKYHTIRQEKITQDVLEVQTNLRDRKKAR